MYTLSQIRSGINALRRKYAREIAIYRLRQLAEELCDQWAVAVADKQPAPEPHTLIRRVNRGRFNCYDSMGLHHYLQRCRRENRCPQPKDFVRSLLPWAWNPRYAHLFRWELPAAA